MIDPKNVHGLTAGQINALRAVFIEHCSGQEPEHLNAGQIAAAYRAHLTAAARRADRSLRAA
jgi:hypothetical protein